MFWVVLLYALFASVFTITKFGLDYVEPLFLVGTRMILAGCLMLAYCLFWRKERFPDQRSTLTRLGLLAVFNIYFTNAFEFWGLQYLTSFKACFIYSLSPFVSALLSYVLLSEKMTPRRWLGFAVGCLGFIPILMSQDQGEASQEALAFLTWPELALTAAAVSTVIGWIVMREVVCKHGCSPIMANGASMLLGGLFALGHSRLVETWDPVPVSSWAPFLYAALATMFISNLICYNLYGYLLKRYTATFMSFAGFTTPVFTALYGYAFLGESVTLAFVVSVAIVLSGLYFFYQEELSDQGIHVAPRPEPIAGGEVLAQ